MTDALAPPAPPRPAPRTSSRAATVALAAVLLAVALVPRVPALDRAFTIDEKLWIERSARFVDAALEARFADAFETGHPGVTTMWIGGLAQLTLPDDAPLEARYARARLWMAVAASLLLVLVWLLAVPLVGRAAATLGALLLALDPFLLAHNRVLHLDGLLALLMLASVIALLRASREGSSRMLLVSGALGGLAALTKQPSVVLLGVVLVVLWRDGRGDLARRLLAWLLAAGAVFVLLWPVLWVRPWRALAVITGGGGRAVVDAGSNGFFLGRRVGDPGPLFYPVAWAWRASPVTFLGGLATIAWAVRRRGSGPAARTTGALLLYALAFLVFMSLGAKKGDRYGLPAFVAVDLAVAVAGARALAATRLPMPATVAAGVAALALHAGPALALHPYQHAHFNWAVGGARTAQWAMVVGWGEGLDEAARDLGRIAPGATVASTRVTQFEEFYPGRTVRLRDAEAHDVVLFYVSSVQTGRFDEQWRRYRDEPELYRLEVNGIPYVRAFLARAAE